MAATTGKGEGVTVSTETDRLISALTEAAGPVRRLRPPVVRSALWLGAAAALIAAITLLHAYKEGHSFHSIAGQFVAMDFTVRWFAALATGVTATLAAFELSLPDRSRAWRLLPLPTALVWLFSIGWGCLTDWGQIGPDGFEFGESFICFGVIVGTSVPLGGLLAWLLRHASAARPTDTIAVGALAVAALTACGLSLYHKLDATLMLLLWTGATTALVLGVLRLSAGYQQRR